MLTAAAWGGVAFALSALLTVVCMPLARRVGAVARPREDRWHRKEIPLLGGLAITAGTVVPLLAAGPQDPKVLVLVVGALLIAGVGLIDDLRTIKPQTKLLGQLVAATLVVAMGLRLELGGSDELDMILTLLWIVAITNAFNLLDNMDGLAAGVAAIAAAFRVGFFALDGNAVDAVTAATLFGAALGFLIFNRNPARIFMGDTGSMFLGFFVAGLSLVGGYPYSRGVLSILLVPALVLLVPIFDTAFVTVTRALARRPISVGGRDHTSHRLVALGLSEKRAVNLLYLIAIVSGAIAYVSYFYGVSRSAVLIVFLVLSVGMLAIYLSRVQVHPPAPVAASGKGELGSLLRVPANWAFTTPVATLLLDFVLIIAAYQAAYLLRFDGDISPVEELFTKSLPIVILAQLLGLAVYRPYEAIWRYTSLVDLARLVKAVTLGTILAVATLALVFKFEGYPRSTFVLDWLLLTVFLCGSRVAFRFLGESLRPPPADSKRIVIYGAGDGGEMALREMMQNPGLGRRAVAFIDDDPAKRRRRIRGIPVVGGADRLEELLRAETISEVIVSTRKIGHEALRRLVVVCEPYGVSVIGVSMHLESHEPLV